MAAPSTALHVLLLLAVLLEGSPGCPRVCICKWKNGKQAVECSNKELLAIPEGIDTETQVLEFCDNNLQLLTKEKFLKMDLINLQRIYLCRCKISSIDDHTFKGLTNLVELDLSGNLLVSVPNGAFIDCLSLMKLSLNGNPIRAIRRSAFGNLSFLTTLELRDGLIYAIEEGAFQGLSSLEWLHLEGNNLTTLKGARTLPQSLRGVDLHGNPWRCDCRITDLHTWLSEYNVPQTIEPTCETPPRLAGRTIRSIPAPELACVPKLTPTTFFIEISEGKNVSLLCHVHAEPEAHVSWWFQGEVLRNDSEIAPGVHLTYFLEEGDEEKDSRLVILNANGDDNGTYVCNAENAAGISHANFTISILVKEEPVMVVVAFRVDYRLVIVIGACSIVFLSIVISIVIVVKCTRNNQKKKREKIKEEAMQYQQSEKCEEVVGVPGKEECRVEECRRESLRTGEVFIPIAVCPSNYQLEQNPDLINDTESGGRRHEGDGEVTISANARELCCSNDVRLSPGCLLDTEGFPLDYGLPKIRAPVNPNCYRTLPYGRSFRRHTAANPLSRFSREAEFLTRTLQPASYEHYCSGVRYTAAGYPPEPGTSEISPVSPCCTPATVHWPTLHTDSVAMKCVGAQTDQELEQEQSNKVELTPTGRNDPIRDVLTESPDEGYEGEPALV